MYKYSIHYFYNKYFSFYWSKFVSFFNSRRWQNQRAINIIAEVVLDDNIDLSKDIADLQKARTVNSTGHLRGRIRQRNDPDQACKNKASGKYFLFIEENDDKKFLLVIPTGEIKPLNPSLFEEIEEMNIADLLNKGLLTQKQIDGYKKFVEQDSIELFREIVGPITEVKNWPEIFTIAKEKMSMEQYSFVINCLLTEVNKLK